MNLERSFSLVHLNKCLSETVNLNSINEIQLMLARLNNNHHILITIINNN